jgi:hypothetical protein
LVRMDDSSLHVMCPSTDQPHEWRNTVKSAQIFIKASVNTLKHLLSFSFRALRMSPTLSSFVLWLVLLPSPQCRPRIETDDLRPSFSTHSKKRSGGRKMSREREIKRERREPFLASFAPLMADEL